MDKLEKAADNKESWDTAMFVIGFVGSLAVTVGSALSLAGFMSKAATQVGNRRLG